ncbi:glycosyltransferase family 4 protein [Ketobacter sp.]|uniref:glycosyltransferase family 4 protein n=1 Tax=Ketobacter sp. TaxID=2083498 RepID=UPI000F2D26B6|nr:glycosyltransferase family 1 protein [Ketobacter sp.]RLT92292.1 MAG: glycosyltransferase family 1 protein [Ketobacter sp.]
MKILFDGRPIRTPLSGVARYCANLSHHLSLIARQENRAQIEVFCQDWKSRNTELQTIIANNDASFRCQDQINPKLANILFEFFPSYAKHFHNKKFDIIHETYFANLGKKTKEKKVVTIHDVIPLDCPEYFNQKNSFFSKRNFYRQVKEADHIICVSEYTKLKVIEYSDYQGPISVIPCGVESPTAPTSESQAKTKDEKRTIDILCLGNIEPRKNIVALASAVAILNKKSPDFRLIVAGYGNYRAAEIISESREILGDNLNYLGPISDTEKWRLLRNVDLFVFPSLYEGFGIPVIESYRAKCAPIFSNCSSLTELAVDERQLFDPRSPIDIAQTIDRFTHDAALKAQTIEKAQANLPKYSWPEIAQNVYNIYQALIDN